MLCLRTRYAHARRHTVLNTHGTRRTLFIRARPYVSVTRALQAAAVLATYSYGDATGLVIDPVFNAGLSNLGFFLAPIDPVAEGATTLPIPLAPSAIPSGLPISYVGVTWGPFGDFHTMTDVFVTTAP